MNINIKYTDDFTGALWLVGDSLSPEDITEANDIFMKDPRFQSLNYLIINLLECTNFLISSEHLQKIAEQDLEAATKNQQLNVLILTGEPLTYSISQAWKTMIADTNWETGIYKAKSEGIKWLENQTGKTVPLSLFNLEFTPDPIHIDFNSEKNLLVHKGIGKIHFGDFLNFYKRLSNYSLKPNYKVIADYSEAQTDLSFDDLLTMAQKRAVTADNMGKISIALVGKTDLIKNLLKVYKALLNKDLFKVEQFDSRLEAEAWLKV